jgi:DNA processing protein
VYWKEAKDRIVVMSQFPPHQPWQVSNAMKRNATAICLSEAFCVIESGDETGGTWQAGLTALKHNVPLYVLDYDDPPESALGNQKLIQKGGVSIHHNNLVFPSKNGTMDTGLTQKSLW